MKNVIPVIVAVVLGLAGVFAVNRMVSKQNAKPEDKIIICAASRTLKANETITEEYIYPKEVGVSSLPQHCFVKIFFQNIFPLAVVAIE